MSNNADIEYMRRLVEKFYQGNTSQAEEQELANFFCEENNEKIPADMLGDAKVFQSLAAMQREAESIPVPDDLAAKLDAIAAEEPAASKPKGLSYLMRYAGIAAACAAIALITVRPNFGDLHTAFSGQGNQTTQNAVDTSKDRLASMLNSDCGTLDDDGYIEVTDPEEANKIIEQIGNILAANLSQSDQAIGKVNNSLESYRKITKKAMR